MVGCVCPLGGYVHISEGSSLKICTYRDVLAYYLFLLKNQVYLSCLFHITNHNRKPRHVYELIPLGGHLGFYSYLSVVVIYNNRSVLHEPLAHPVGSLSVLHDIMASDA